MNPRVILLVCALLVAASSLATCNKIFKDTSLNWYRLPAQYKSFKNLEITEDLLYSLNAKSTERIIKNINSRRVDKSYETVLKDLRSFVDIEKPCTKEVKDRVLQICSILHYDKDGKLNGIAKLLMEVGKKKFGRATWGLVNDLIVRSDEKRISERQLDAYFAACLDNDHDILKALTSLDLTKSKFEFGKGKSALSQTGHGNFYDFMLESCSTLWEGSHDIIDIITLAQAFGYSREYPPDVLKLIEYHRLCLSLWREDLKDEVIENLIVHNTRSR